MTTRYAKTRYTAEVKILCVVLWGVLLGIDVSVHAQTNKLPRVGYLTALSTSSDAARTAALRQGLRDLAYIDRKNIIFEVHSTGGKADGLAALAVELVRSKADIIVTGGPTATRPAKQATSTIPIIMAQDNDPVGNGFVASLARPGGNITGLSSYTTELNGKRLELLKEIVPRLARVAVLGTSTNPGNAQALEETERAANAFGVKVQYLEVRDPT